MRFNIVCGAVLHGLWCALSMLTGVCGKRNLKEEGVNSLIPSSIVWAWTVYVALISNPFEFVASSDSLGS